MGIKVYGSNYLIDYNKLTNLGYNGIDFGGNNVKVDHNYIDGYAYVKDDCGAIYTSSFNTLYTGREITNNVILNGNLVPSGSGDPWLQAAAKGIYLDQHNTDILVQYNTISHSFSGIAVQNGHEIDILENTIYDCIESLTIYHTNAWPDDQLRNLNIQRNKFVNKDEHYQTTDGTFDYTLSTLGINAESIDGETDLKQYGVSDYNYYVKPLTTSTKRYVMRTTVSWKGVPVDSNDGWKSFSEWKSWSGNDANSRESPKPILSTSDLRFEYNPTNSSKTISLDANYINVEGTAYSGSVTLQPYSSIVFIRDN